MKNFLEKNKKMYVDCFLDGLDLSYLGGGWVRNWCKGGLGFSRVNG